ncbi:MAG: hypothetical protein AABW54_04340 [Candidatus Micrarchaeota archaeon]
MPTFNRGTSTVTAVFSKLPSFDERRLAKLVQSGWQLENIGNRVSVGLQGGCSPRLEPELEQVFRVLDSHWAASNARRKSS